MSRAPIDLLKRVRGLNPLRAGTMASRSLGFAASAIDYMRAVRLGSAPGPLLHAVRVANHLASRILQQPTPVPTPAQRRTLLAAAAQLRALTSRIIVSAHGSDPASLESELAELVRRTLTLIERVTTDPIALNGDTHRTVVDAEIWVAPRLPNDGRDADR